MKSRLLHHNKGSLCISGDFGGYIGLFLGASAMTVFEVIDAVIYPFIKKKMASPKKIKNTKRNNQNVVENNQLKNTVKVQDNFTYTNDYLA